MSQIPRRTLDEIRARYAYEPQLRDLYVEGLFDKELFEVFDTDTTGRSVYEISSVEIPGETLLKYGLNSGNKSRVIALAFELSDLANLDVICLADSDFDHWTLQSLETQYLVRTPVCSIDCFFLTEVHVSQVIGATRMKVGDIPTFYPSLLTALKTAYALKLVTQEANVPVGWLPLDKNLGKTGDVVDLDLHEYSKRCMQAAGFGNQAAELVQQAQDRFDALGADHRLAVRGHDYTDMLAWCVKAFGGIKELGKAEHIQRIFYVTATQNDELRAFVSAHL